MHSDLRRQRNCACRRGAGELDQELVGDEAVRLSDPGRRVGEHGRQTENCEQGRGGGRKASVHLVLRTQIPAIGELLPNTSPPAKL